MSGRYGPVALLVLLAAAAGTGIIASHLGLLASLRAGLWSTRRRFVARLLLAAAARFDGLTRALGLALRNRHLAALLGALELHVEQLLAHIAGDDPHHLAEDDEPFLLVLL